jgi:hypothetical protein
MFFVTTKHAAIHHVLTTEKPSKNAHFLQNPHQKHHNKKSIEHQESLTPPPERDTLFKFGAVALCASISRAAGTTVSPVHAPHAAQSIGRSG